MKRFLQLAFLFVVAAALPALRASASDREDDISRINAANAVFHEIMSTPDKAIPQELLESAQCIAIIPSEKKGAFIVGASYGRGLVTCRTDKGWSAPVFLMISGGSVGFQIGGSSTDLVLIFRNRRGLDKLLSDNFKIGADATAAAGPVGRHAAAATDLQMHAEILTYSRSRGAFAGVSLDGSVVKPDNSGDHALYGEKVNRQELLNGQVAAPAEAHALLQEIARNAGKNANARKE